MKVRMPKISLTYKRKLVVLVLLLTLIPVLIISTILYSTSASIISEQVSTSFINRLNFSVQNIDNILGSIELISYPALVDTKLEAKLRLPADSEAFREYETFSYIKKTLDSFLYANKYIDSVYLYSVPEEWLVGAPTVGRTVLGNEITNLPWLMTVKSKPKLDKWVAAKGITQSNGETKNLIVNYKYIGSNSTNKPVGILSINIDRNFIEKFLAGIVTDNVTTVVVLDSKNNVVGTKNSILIGNKFENLGVILQKNANEDRFISNINSMEMLTAYYTSSYTGWKYIMITPMKALKDKVSWIFIVTIISFSLVMILGIIAAFILPLNMTKPINVLNKSMKAVKTGQFDYRIKETRKDEFGELYDGFNDMVGNLDKLIHEIYQHKLVKKDIQLKMMQSQINAHFLYNTLDVIHWIAKINKVDIICNLTFALSKYFRISLSEGKDVIRIHEVISLISNYMEIHRIKSEKDIRLELNVPEELQNERVLKYIFQPIIENAIQHGIEKTRREGVLHFTCLKSAENLLFIVEDNGKGIEAETLTNIRSDLENGDFVKAGNFALKNINNQIKIFYGDSYGLSIDSEYDHGTIVKMVIPVLQEEEKNV
jgi:two-component system, sensor histidine kinase YesM